MSNPLYAQRPAYRFTLEEAVAELRGSIRRYQDGEGALPEGRNVERLLSAAQVVDEHVTARGALPSS